MKPQQPNIAYCIEHKDWLVTLRARYGEWQEGDRTLIEEELIVVHTVGCDGLGYRLRGIDMYVFHSDDMTIWLPSEGDVLAMLEARGYNDLRIVTTTHWPGRPLTECYLVIVDPLVECKPRAYGVTRLIALLELLRAVEEKG